MTDGQIIQLISIIYLAFGLGAMVDRGYLKEVLEGFFRNPVFAWLVGLLAVVMGYLIVIRPASFEGWSILVTVIGWIALIKGVFGLAFPKAFSKLAMGMLQVEPLVTASRWVVLLGGFLLAYVGFFVL